MNRRWKYRKYSHFCNHHNKKQVSSNLCEITKTQFFLPVERQCSSDADHESLHQNEIQDLKVQQQVASWWSELAWWTLEADSIASHLWQPCRTKTSCRLVHRGILLGVVQKLYPGIFVYMRRTTQCLSGEIFHQQGLCWNKNHNFHRSFIEKKLKISERVSYNYLAHNLIVFSPSLLLVKMLKIIWKFKCLFRNYENG